MGTMQSLARQFGRSHALAAALWKTGWYEARMLAAMIDEPDRVTPAQMERWAKSFDNWAVCDTATFVLFDRTPHAWAMVRAWSTRREEFVKRAAFAMLASLTIHDKQAPDERYLEGLALIEREAGDDRNFVKKAVNWALRSIGKRSPKLNRAAVAVARRLSKSADPARRWVGSDALRELTSPGVTRRLAAKAKRAR
jgi:3-methyladenine DNA glycosylase AlkD